ncbi:MAG: glutamine amidotransferase [Actinomycetia bacterium]|nr:glutamine amidotransferase [Actinomycetes bacterium]
MPPAEPPVVGVLALQGDVAEHLRALEQAGARPLAVRSPAALDQAAGLIIPGGESTTIWKLSEIFGLAGPLRKRVAAGMPVFGSCAGMIMLAGQLADPASGQETLGAIDMTVRRNAFGRQADSFETDLSIAVLDGGPYRGVFIRAPWAERVGEDAEVLAVEPRTGKVVAVRQGPALATAFHPELTGDRRIHELFVNIVRQES